MTAPRQLNLIPPPAPPVPEHEIRWLIDLLHGRDWMTAADILTQIGQPVVESTRRRIRALAAGSQGRIAGGQAGYKLVSEMTRDEYHHYRNWMTSQAAEMQRRVIESDRHFYARRPVPVPA